jgi:hypothetical protein
MKTNRILMILGFAAGAGVWLPQTAPAQDGFLFRNPQVTWNLRLGTARPAAQGDIFKFLTTELTLDREDFASFTWGGDLNFRIDPRADILLGASVSQSSKSSEFERWTDEDELPIEQVTELRRIPITAGIKFFPLSRGREIGRYAFVPTRFAPYLGGAAGVMLYTLEQSGDFVDFETLDIFTDFFESSGAAPTVQAFGGADLWILPRVGINVEARYSWASAELKDAFSDFEDIDLRGFQLTSGLSVRF